MSYAPSPFADERVMSISASEFAASIALTGAHTLNADGTVVFDIGRGRVEITFAELPGVRLGGLLHLPRAKVCLKFRDVSPEQRTQFLRLFDVAFQRGGG